MKSATFLVTILFLCGNAASAGTHLTAESRDLRSEAPTSQRSVLWLDGPNLRLEADGDHTLIYRAEQDLAWAIDHGTRSYRVIDRATVETLAQGVGRANESARRYIALLPPAQRQAAERLLDQTVGSVTRVSPDIEVRALGTNARIAGVPCAIYEIHRGGSRRAEVCRASYEAASVADATRDAVRALTASLGGVLPVLAPEHLRQDSVDALHAFTKLDGVPMRVRLYEQGSPVWETLVTDVGAREAPATAFELPDGYQRRPVLSASPTADPATPAPR